MHLNAKLYVKQSRQITDPFRSSTKPFNFLAYVISRRNISQVNLKLAYVLQYLARAQPARSKDVVGRVGRRWRRGTERASCCLTGSRESEARLYVGVTLPYAYLHRLAPSFAATARPLLPA